MEGWGEQHTGYRKAGPAESWELSFFQRQSQLFLTKNLLCSPVIRSGKKGAPN